MKRKRFAIVLLSGILAISSLGIPLQASALTQIENNYQSELTVNQINDTHQTTQYVYMPDENLRKALNTKYLKQEANAPITQQQLRRLQGTLYLGNSKISDLTGLEHCVGVTGLYLSYNEISDISPLKKLSKLKYLNLTQQKITADDIITTNDTATVSNILVGISKENILPTKSSAYNYNPLTNQITFNNITQTGEKSYNFKYKVSYGSQYTTYFSGTVTQNIIR